MNIYPVNIENIKKAAEIIRSGGLVAFPTETVYGLGADALNPMAVAGIFEAKNRPFFDPLIVHIASLDYIERISGEFGELEQKLAAKFWPGPLTLVLPKRDIIPDIVTAGMPTVAVRMPVNEAAIALIIEAGTPVAAPSANLFGHISPTKAEHVFSQFGERIGMILDGGRCDIGVESTIVKIENGRPALLRHGGIPAEEIEAAAGIELAEPAENPGPGGNAGMESPGRLPYHYSPQTPLVIIDDLSKIVTNYKAGFLAFTNPGKGLPFAHVEVLSADGNMREAASNLFSCLHTLDSSGLDIIYAERVPETGIGKAIMDRLVRAAGRNKHKM